ncbi:hypothetical protein PIB30_092551 [Stylosanthes scabra]|uniref:Uncharacterized protein n=1 Tax=Stylosanthes scabra TaxID=79078 RepID=A0ABU6TUB1_9FABA|nr:hypothetical protein [Stylosanthes scabra]
MFPTTVTTNTSPAVVPSSSNQYDHIIPIEQGNSTNSSAAEVLPSQEQDPQTHNTIEDTGTPPTESNLPAPSTAAPIPITGIEVVLPTSKPVLMNDNHCGVDYNHQRFEDSLESKQQQRRKNEVRKFEVFRA